MPGGGDTPIVQSIIVHIIDIPDPSPVYFGIPMFLDSWDSGFEIPGFLDSWIPGVFGSWIPGFLDSWIPGFLNRSILDPFRIPGFLNGSILDPFRHPYAGGIRRLLSSGVIKVPLYVLKKWACDYSTILLYKWTFRFCFHEYINIYKSIHRF